MALKSDALLNFALQIVASPAARRNHSFGTDADAYMRFSRIMTSP